MILIPHDGLPAGWYHGDCRFDLQQDVHPGTLLAMSITTPPPAAPRFPELHSLELRCWYLRDRPLLAGLAVLLIAATAAVIYFVSASMPGTIGCTTALIVAMRRMFLPIEFHLDPVGVTRRLARQTRRIPWTAIARYEICQRGVVLFPYGADYRLAAGQGLFIPWNGHREELLAILAEFVDG